MNFVILWHWRPTLALSSSVLRLQASQSSVGLLQFPHFKTLIPSANCIWNTSSGPSNWSSPFYVGRSSSKVSYFLSREWKQIETWKLLEETWLFFRLGEAKWQHCTSHWMLVTRSSCRSVFDTEMATFTFEEQHVIIRLLHLRGMKPIEIHRQLSETCTDGVMDVKNVRSWVRQFKEGRTSCDAMR